MTTDSRRGEDGLRLIKSQQQKKDLCPRQYILQDISPAFPTDNLEYKTVLLNSSLKYVRYIILKIVCRLLFDYPDELIVVLIKQLGISRLSNPHCTGETNLADR